MTQASSLIDEVPIFQSCSPHWREELKDSSLREIYQRGAVLFRQGAAAEHVWLILKGWVHIVRKDFPDGDRDGVVLMTVTPRELVCGVSAFEAGNYTASGIAATNVEALRISSGVVIRALKQQPGFAYELLCACNARMRCMAEQYGAMTRPVPDRIVHILLRLQDQFGARLPVTHRELAQMAWTTTESAIRTVSRLKKKGYLSGMRGVLMIKRPQKLAELVSNGNGHAEVS